MPIAWLTSAKPAGLAALAVATVVGIVTLFPADAPTQDGPKKNANSKIEVVERAGDGFPLPAGAIHRFGSRRLRHPEVIRASAVSPDGKYLATLGTSCVVVWDMQTLAAKRKITGAYFGSYGFGDSTKAISFLPDSKTLLVTVRPTDRTSISVNTKVELAQVWDVETGKKKFGITGGWGFAFASWLVDGGKAIAVLSGYREQATIRYIDPKDGKELQSVNAPLMNRGVWVSPSGHLMVETDGRGNGFKVVDTKKVNEVDSVADCKLIQAAFSPDDKKLIYHDDTGTVHVRDLSAKKELFTFKHPAEKQRGPMQFSKDQQTLYFGGQYGQLFRWDLKNNKRLPDVGKHSTWTLTCIALSPDESILYSMGGDQLIKRWDLKTGKQLPLPEGYITQTAIVPAVDGKNLINADHVGHIDYWNLATGKHGKQLQPGNTGGINCVATSADGHWFAGGRTVQDVQLWDLRSGKLAKTFGLVEQTDQHGGDHVQRVFFRPDGKVLFTTSGKTGITAWSVPEAKQLWRVEKLGPHAACDVNGRWIAIGGGYSNEQVHWTLLDAKTGQTIRQVEVPTEPVQPRQGILYPPYLNGVEFSPDSSRVITAHYDGVVRVWDPNTGKLVQKFGGTRMGAQCVACSDDGRLVGVGGADRKIAIWELATGKEVLELTGHDSAVRDVAFTRDSKGIIGNADLSPILWSLAPKDLPGIDGADAMWETLGSEDGAKAYRLVWALAKEPKRAISLFHERIDAKSLALAREQFDKWVAGMDSPRFCAREVAERNLMQAGVRVPVEWLRKALADAKSDELIARLNRVMVQREKPDPNERRLGRAVQILELAGTNEAKAFLKTWADAGGSGLALDAKAALQRLR